MCQEPLWAKFKAKYRFRQCQGVHTGFSSWLGPHVFPLRWVPLVHARIPNLDLAEKTLARSF